ncbi:MAG: energy-coupling factor transporter transmembrane component T [Methanocorpusculum sp.]|uniref:energy-coupling factor transporter transmembrane component T family protein n=1 Tax=Methanocorpusculum sp. TaxID=2058474 RepID=UPI002B218A1E|nr:energy-coupling factor transporter transmembrane component T [Methanocorpusculum sp.]MEA5087153.1 energy-coupling factor transporter transmembrane component T [Methanocorpusculum sp.]
MEDIMQYIPGNRFVHRLSPMTKIFFAVGMMFAAIFTSNPLLLLAMVVFVLAFAAIGGLLKPLIRQVPLLIILGLALVVLTVLTSASGDVLFALLPNGMFPVTTGAIMFAVQMALRFAVLIFSFQLLVISTQPRDLVNALYTLRIPGDYALMFLIAIRFIPTLQREGVRINEAQLSRGYFPGGGVIGKLKQLGPVMLPLMLNSLAKADTLGLTIDMRGYRKASEHRRKMVYHAADLVTVLIVAAIFAGIVYVTFIL